MTKVNPLSSFQKCRTSVPTALLCEHCGHARIESAAICQECGTSCAARTPWIRRPRARANLAAWAAVAWVLVPIFDYKHGRNFSFLLGWCCARVRDLSFSSDGFSFHTGELALWFLCSLVASILAGFAWRRSRVGARAMSVAAALFGWTLVLLMLRAGPG